MLWKHLGNLRNIANIDHISIIIYILFDKIIGDQIIYTVFEL